LTFDAHPRSSLIVALDFDSLSTALRFAGQVSDLVGMFKIGSQLFTTAGPEAVRQVAKLGADIFLDLKFHDIPNTVAGAVLATAALPGLQLVNVHALGGTAMMHAAAQAVSAGVPMGADREGSRDRRTAKLARSEVGEARAKSGRGRCCGFSAGSQGHPQSLWSRFPDRDSGCAP
jgi:3-keto-L-gulonate-6-phosphate decarboxylase